jgi:hypothetical protein
MACGLKSTVWSLVVWGVKYTTSKDENHPAAMHKSQGLREEGVGDDERDKLAARRHENRGHG